MICQIFSILKISSAAASAFAIDWAKEEQVWVVELSPQYCVGLVSHWCQIVANKRYRDKRFCLLSFRRGPFLLDCSLVLYVFL
jgi:hypothetical protein